MGGEMGGEMGGCAGKHNKTDNESKRRKRRVRIYSAHKSGKSNLEDTIPLLTHQMLTKLTAKQIENSPGYSLATLLEENTACERIIYYD